MPKHQRILVGAPDHPLIEFEAEDSLIPLNRLSRVSDEKLAQLSSLLGPALLGMLAASSQAIYTLKFAPAVAQQLADGSAWIASARGQTGLRAFALNARGRIVGQGTLVQTHASLCAITAVWSTMAWLSSQYGMVLIVRRLNRIEAGIAAIQHWLATREVVQLQSYVAQLAKLKHELINGTIDPADVQEFTGHFRAMQRELKALLGMSDYQLEQQRAALKAMRLGRLLVGQRGAGAARGRTEHVSPDPGGLVDRGLGPV